MGRKLDALLGKTFRSAKCKTLLKLTVSRVKLLKNKRELQCKQARKDVAELLQNGQEASARLRVEHVLREQNMVDAYLLIEGYCYAVTERMISVEKQKTCPSDLKESIASLIFAAPRCGELPELQDVRSLFAAKFGKEFTTAAIELRPDCGVNRQIIEKLSTRVPSAEIKLGLMKEIAVEHGIEWDFEKVQSEMLKPAEDLLDGPRQQLFGAGQRISKPVDGARQDSIPETTEVNSASDERSKPPATVIQPTSSAYYSQPPPSTAFPDVRPKDQQQFLPFAMQGHGKWSNAEMHDSAPPHAPFHEKDESVVSPKSETDLHSHASEDDPYTSLQMEGPKQENMMYTDVASAAQAAFESAAYAAAAARAAVDLARRESGHKNLNQTADDSREASSESEDDQLDEIISRERTEGKYAKSDHRFGRDVEETSSAKDGEAYGIKGFRETIHEARDASSTASGFERIHPSHKFAFDSENGEEPLEEPASWSKDGRFSVHKSNQPHFDVYDDSHEEYESNALSENTQLHNKQEYREKSKPQMKTSMSGIASDSSDQSSSSKASQPFFDNYGDDEDDYEKVPLGRSKYQSTLKEDGRSEMGNFHDQPLQYTASQKRFDDHNKDLSYEIAGVRRKEYQKQDYMNETESIHNMSSFQMKFRPSRSSDDEADLITQRLGSRPIKHPSRDFLQQETHSMQNLEAESDDDGVVEPLNNIGGIQFQYGRKLAMPVLRRSPLDDDPPSPHHVRKGMREGLLSNATRTLDSEGAHRYEGDGKLHWCPANPEEEQQHVAASVQSRKSATRRDNGKSVRTRRVARQQDDPRDEDEPASNTIREFPLTLPDDDLSARFEALRRKR